MIGRTPEVESRDVARTHTDGLRLGCAGSFGRSRLGRAPPFSLQDNIVAAGRCAQRM